MNKNKTRIVIAGGGTAGWSAAAFLVKNLSQRADITLIESSDIPTVGVGEATIPLMVTFNELLGIDEAEFMKAVDGTFKLGIEFEGWGRKESSYIHPFSRPGRDFWPCNFFHYWLASKPSDISDYEKYCTGTLAARQEKFSILSNKRLMYAYHFDAGKYAKFLKFYSEARGVLHVDDLIEGVNLKGDGSISSLTLKSGKKIDGDLFIDCTGFKALLMEGALKTGYEDWSHWLPCDSAIAVQTKSTENSKPYTRSIAHGSGWRWRIPLQTRMGNGLVYSSQHISHEAAKDELLGCIEAPIKEPKVNRFQTGMRKKQWNKNCVSVGLSGGFLEPLESTSIYFIQRNLIRLVQLFEGSVVSPSVIDEFNSQSRKEMESVRDFIILHYKVTDREDTPFWQYCKNMSVPDELQHRIDLFKETGRVFKKDHELFNDFGWAQIMMGQGLIPDSYHPFVDEMSKKELADFLSSVENSVARFVSDLPSHKEFIERFCPSSTV
jgi:tryptophan halogenase